jgi:hypothetical protein
MRLYFEIYLNQKDLEPEEFIFFLKECILTDFDNRNIAKQVSCFMNKNIKDNRLIYKHDEFFKYLVGGKS